jgi:predicted esterase
MSVRFNRITVNRSARYFYLGERPGAEEVWFVLHGYSQLAQNFLKWFEPAARPGRLIVAPEALSRSYFEEQGSRRVGASWMTKEDRETEIEDYIRYLDQVADEVIGTIPPRPRVEVHGFSQGGATAGRWITYGRHLFDRVVLWGSTLPPDLDLERLRANLRDVPLVLATGDRDQFVLAEQIRSERIRLAGLGINVEQRSFVGGHVVDRETLARLSAAERKVP